MPADVRGHLHRSRQELQNLPIPDHSGARLLREISEKSGVRVSQDRTDAGE